MLLTRPKCGANEISIYATQTQHIPRALDVRVVEIEEVQGIEMFGKYEEGYDVGGVSLTDVGIKHEPNVGVSENLNNRGVFLPGSSSLRPRR